MTSLPRFSVNNPVIINLFMMMILVGGVYSGLTLVRALVPETRPQSLTISTRYPGASPAEVEKGITLKIEERIKDLTGVEKISSTVLEGVSLITVEFGSRFKNIDQAINDVKAAIDSIPRGDFPEDALESQVTKIEFVVPVISASVYGDLDNRTLKTFGEKLRDDILSLPGVTKAILIGSRKDEISIEVEPQNLVRYGLSLVDIAQIVGASNLDLPGGQIRTQESNVSVRTLGERDRGEELGNLLIASDRAGGSVRLDTVATIADGFEDVRLESRFNGFPGVTVSVSMTPEQDTVAIAAQVNALVAGKMGRPLKVSWLEGILGRLPGGSELRDIYELGKSDPFPPNVLIDTHGNYSRFITGRLDLLKRNGAWGLMLVFASLLVFLHWRVAFWVMMGLILAICGSLICLRLMGQTLNLMSAFGLILVLGLLVDDAIIVAEHVYTKVEQGVPPALAAVTGAEEVTWPVTCAIVTTIMAFAPLMFLDGQIGDWMRVLPLVVCVALSVSLVEALTILPSHLAHSLRPLIRRGTNQANGSHEMPLSAAGAATGATNDVGAAGQTAVHPGRLRAMARRVREIEGGVLMPKFRDKYRQTLRLATRYRYVTIAALVTCLMPMVGLVAGRHLPFVLIQEVDAEILFVALQMGPGVPVERTRKALSVVERVVLDVEELESMQTFVGLHISTDGMGVSVGSHLGQIIIELSPSEERQRSSDEILQQIRTQTKDIPDVEKLNYVAMDGGPGGAPIHLEIRGEHLDDLASVADEIQERLAEFDGVYDIVDDFEAGRAEVQIELFDSARALGLTTQSLAIQVRAAFYGFEARKVQRGREDVRIMVRYPPEHRKKIHDVESMWIATPTGDLVPFREVGRLTDATGYNSIKRTDQQRRIIVKAEVNEDVTNAGLVIGQLAPHFAELQSRYPGIEFVLGGHQLEMSRSFASLITNSILVVGLIYTILAGLFRSYVQPMIVMAIIPFGIIGALVGHLLMGYPLTMLSVIGLVALTGIVVNDAMILMVFINRSVSSGVAPHDAVIEGGLARLRPILLTSVTTVLGIAPILLETSFQAKVLIPLAISISGGLIFATVLTLIAVPALYLIVIDLKRVAASLGAFLLGRPSQASPIAN